VSWDTREKCRRVEGHDTTAVAGPDISGLKQIRSDVRRVDWRPSERETMGVLYVVVPLDTEVAAWLDGEAILHPPPSDRATMPSPREILEVLDMLGGLRIAVNRDEANARIDIDIAEVGGERSTTLRLSECIGDDQPCRLALSKGSEDLIGIVVEALATRFGPLVIVPDTGEDPAVYSGTQK
jgi:hypothetical protein